jgi:monoamine oxidase
VALSADVVVVGAGLSGLVAARAIRAAGQEALVLEARPRVGGRLFSVQLDGGTWVDVGGQWIGPTQNRIEGLAREFGVATFPTYDEGDSVIEYAGARRRYRGTIPKVGAHVLLDVQQMMWRLDRMARRVPVVAPWRAEKAREWDSQTLATWMRRNGRTEMGRALLTLGCEAVFAVEPADVSLLHVLFYLASGGGWDMLLDTRGGAQQDRFVTGAQTVPNALAAELGDAVKLSEPVRRIEHSDTGVVVHSDNLEVKARRAIVATPPVLAGRIDYDPPLPVARDQLTQRVPMGTVIKCMAIYERPFWRDEGLSGAAVSDRGPVKVIYDNSPPGGEPGILLGFFEGRHAREYSRVSELERRHAALDCFARTIGPRARDAVGFVERDWASEPWSRGCYGCHLPTGTWTDYGHALRVPIGRLHWAGTETATTWSGYMDGAVQAGERAAREALEAPR